MAWITAGHGCTALALMILSMQSRTFHQILGSTLQVCSTLLCHFTCPQLESHFRQASSTLPDLTLSKVSQGYIRKLG